MDLKKVVCTYLQDICQERLSNLGLTIIAKKTELIKKQKFGNVPFKKMESQLRRNALKGNIIANRIKDNEDIIRKISLLHFEECHDENLLGEGYVFCDRQYMYYHPNIFLLNEEQIVGTILCELFNSWQDYAIITRTKESRKQLTIYQSALMMYHIGFITEKLWYSIQRHKNALRMEKCYPEIFNKYKLHAPTQAQADYIILKAIDTKRPLYGSVDNVYITGDVIEARISLAYYIIKETGLYIANIPETDVITTFFVINEDGSKTRVQWNKKELATHKDVTELAKKLMENAAI